MEALGAASSVIAVISLGLQLANSVQRLVDFWDSVKDAPSEVAEIRSQLKVLGALLRSIESDTHQSLSDSESSLGNDCLLICKASVAKLEKLSKAWNQELSRTGIRRKWSCLKKAFGEKKLASYWGELERAKSMLILYQCLKNGRREDSLLRVAARKVPMSQQINQLEQQSTTRGASLNRPMTHVKRFRKLHLGTTLYEVQLSFGTIRVRLIMESVIDKSSHPEYTEIISRRRQRKIVATFLPKFTSWRILECSFNQRYNSIDAGFRSFNLRPGWSPIFEYSSRGDSQNVRKLIEEGLASPNDVDPKGWTVLHYAAASHQPAMCQILIALGAVPDPVTNRQETPLHLACDPSPRVDENFRADDDDVASLDTVRVLVEQGKNDPMQGDDIGFNSIFGAAKGRYSHSLVWLVNQDEFELDLNYATPAGFTAAAMIVQREDLSSQLFEPLLRNGIALDAPCAKMWRFRSGYWFLRFKEPSMIQYAVWTWYDELLNSYDRKFSGRYQLQLLQPISSPLATLKTLLAHGASLYAKTESMHELLDGMVLNIIQFDGDERPPAVLAAAMSIWLGLVQDLGFDLKDYLRAEAARLQGRYYYLGLGIRMIVCFNHDTAPHIWTIFQGHEERENDEFVDRISKCAIWKEWQKRYSLPRRLPQLKHQKLLEKSTDIFLVKKRCSCSSGDSHVDGCGDTEHSLTTQNPPSSLASLPSTRRRRIIQDIIYYIISGAPYRREFTFYALVLTCFFGCSCFARLWIAAGFFVILKLIQEICSYWI